jgi:hypothetical protein
MFTMFTKSFQIAIALFLVLGLSVVSFGAAALAQTTDGYTDTTTNGTTGTDTTDTTGTTDTMDTSGTTGTTDTSTTGTTPGVPNTGLGGNATTNILLLVISAAVALAGVGYISRTSLGVR